MTNGPLWNAVKLAFDTIRAYKLRAFLTVLGVIIGTGTIIGVGSILTGLDGAISSVLSSFGTNTILAFKFQVGVRFGNLTPEERLRKPLTFENARAIAERCPSVEHVSPILFPNMGIVKARYKANEFYQLDFSGAQEGYIFGGNAEMKYGRFFSDAEGEHRRPVVVIGEDVYKGLFASGDPSGKWIEVAGHMFEVIGVMNRPSSSFPGDNDGRVIVPYFTMRKMFPNSREHLLLVVAKPGQLHSALDEVRVVLRQERHVAHDKPDNFGLSTAEQMVEQFRKTTAMTAVVMVVLSSIGLLVGGIGVMNIMLVSVTERTREIGVRKALGARRIDIVVQFLIEAAALTGLGGLLGMLMGWVLSTATHVVFPNLPTTVPLWAAAAGLVVSVGVGLFFGIWPASKAARLDPVVALRYE